MSPLALSKVSTVLRTTFADIILCGVLTILSALWVATSARAVTVKINDKITIETDDWWQQIASPFQNTKELVGGRAPDGTIQARASISVIRHSSEKSALARLLREGKLAGKAQALRIAGQPAVQATDQIELERRVQNLPSVKSKSQQITTFIAIDRLVVKIAVTLANNAAADSVKKAEQLESFIHLVSTLSAQELDSAIGEIERAITTKPRSFASPLFFAGAEPSLLPVTTLTTQSSPPVLATNRGELEVAASRDGTDVVIGTNNGTVFSNDGGATWSANQGFPGVGVAGVTFQRRGDPSVGHAPSGRFFLSFLGREQRGAAACNAAGADCRDTVSIALSEPAERGAGFDFRSHVAVCDPAADPFGTDQPHLVIARQPPDLDRETIYVVWRRSVPNDGQAPASCSSLGASHFVTQLNCSDDGGLTWRGSTKIDDRGRHPRLGVAANGKPYVIAVRSSGGGAIDLTRTSSCADGLIIEDDFPVVVDNFDGVACPVAGLDRCNDGNTLSSPTVSPDPNRALTVFVSFATRTADGNENIVVRASEDGGLTFPAATTANDTAAQARRFMPWSCAVNEGVYVGWYDREAATATNNDLTTYHMAFFRYRPDNNLTTVESFRRFRPVDASRGVADAQCSLWPAAPRNIGDAENCSRQPQQAGRVPGADGTCSAPGPGRCDFSDSATTTPSLNCCLGLGSPKYGDYNGIACTGQSAFVAWASATAPAGAAAPPANSIGTYFAVVNHAEPPTPLICAGLGPACIGLARERIDFECPAELCDIRVPVPKLCEEVINCPVCGSQRLCTGNDGFVLEGLPPESHVALIDEHGRVLQRASSGTGTTQRIHSLRNLFVAEAGAAGLTLEIRVKLATTALGKQSVKIAPESSR